jgi:Tfp pilus assembly protein PilV
MRWMTDESGMTLIEVAIAMALLMIGLLTLLQAFPTGIAAMEGGRQQSTAVFLAEQRLEQIKAWSLSTQTVPAQGFATVVGGGTCFTNAAGPCRPQAYDTIPGYLRYRIAVATAADGVTRTQVTVQVFYRPILADRVAAELPVTLRTLLTQR